MIKLYQLHGIEVLQFGRLVIKESYSKYFTYNYIQVETGTSIRTLYGHDGELTYVSCHQTKPLVITSSRKFILFTGCFQRDFNTRSKNGLNSFHKPKGFVSESLCCDELF